jgi:hypothetical protein
MGVLNHEFQGGQTDIRTGTHDDSARIGSVRAVFCRDGSLVLPVSFEWAVATELELRRVLGVGDGTRGE